MGDVWSALVGEEFKMGFRYFISLPNLVLSFGGDWGFLVDIEDLGETNGLTFLFKVCNVFT